MHLRFEISELRLSDSVEKEIAEKVSLYPDKRSAILPVLHILQREEGHVTEAGMRYASAVLGLSPVQVYDVATFYTLYALKPIGRYWIQVCKTLSCALVGADNLIRYLETTLGIRAGETTDDGLFTLATVECLASCGTGPMMQINEDYYENLTKEKVDEILNALRLRAQEGS
jgi:NADH-quinone oxidoreductase subunit E